LTKFQVWLKDVTRNEASHKPPAYKRYYYSNIGSAKTKRRSPRSLFEGKTPKERNEAPRNESLAKVNS
jgi:hypothetical protein